MSSALASINSRWDLPVFTLPFNILVCVHMVATGHYNHHFPQVLIQPRSQLPNITWSELDVAKVSDPPRVEEMSPRGNVCRCRTSPPGINKALLILILTACFICSASCFCVLHLVIDPSPNSYLCPFPWGSVRSTAVTTPGREEFSLSRSSSPRPSPVLMLFWDQLWGWCLVREPEMLNKRKQQIFPNLKELSKGWYLPSSRVKVLSAFAGLALAAPFGDIYFGLWGYNCVLACIAVGGMFYALTWQVHLLALTCGEWTQWRESHLVQLDPISGSVTNP